MTLERSSASASSNMLGSDQSVTRDTRIGKGDALRAYVINLAKNPQRWEAIARSAADFAPGIELVRIDAVNGRAPEHAGREAADVPTFERLNGREMLPGEYGCYLSHLEALRQFLDDGSQYGLILEDDAAFEEGSEDRIRAIIDELPAFGAVKLVNHRAKFLVELLSTSEHDRIGRTVHGPQGSAAAYLVTREGAQRLLDALSTMTLPWDVALEGAWHHGAEIFSVEKNVLAFTEEREKSDISGGGYAKAKYPWYQRFGAASARSRDYSRRIGYAFTRPDNAGVAQAEPLPWQQMAAGVLFLAFISAVWLESDAYRISGGLLILAALWRYYSKDIWDYRRLPEIGWMGRFCLLWGAYVLIRFGISLSTEPDKGIGSSEGIYLLPALYPTLGYAMYLFVRRPFLIASIFMVVSLAALGFGIDYLGPEIRARARLQNNPIHASVAVGLICLCAVPYAVHALRRRDLGMALRGTLAALGLLVFILSGIAIYNLWSKGVWLAMIVALPVLLMTMIAAGSRTGKQIAVAAALIALAGVVLNYQTLVQVAGGTVGTTALLLAELQQGNSATDTLRVLISDPSTQASEMERMKIWFNALSLWGENPLIGAGVGWLSRWSLQLYATPYNLLHNGYLEVAVRYGWTGLAFYGVLFGWTVITVYKAARLRLIDVSALQAYVATLMFFAVTLVSNSNIRLAIGETYMWFAAGFTFYCHFLLVEQKRREAASLHTR